MSFYIVIALVLIVFMIWGRKNLYVPSYKGPKTDHFDGKKFFNPSGNEMGSFRKLMISQMKGNRTKWPKFIELSVDQEAVYPKVETGLSYKQINHATILIQHKGVNIITDPVFAKRASPVQFTGPARHRDPSISLEDLPSIDLVVISHDHYDHLDLQSLKFLSDNYNPKILVGLGLKKYLEKFEIENVEELDWQESSNHLGIKSTFLKCRHWSNRFASPYKTLWGSWIIESDEKTVYYAGDTAFDDHFSEIKKQFPVIDLALIPVGAYEPRFFMKYVHMNPEDAYKAHSILDPKESFAIHWGTFQLTDEGMFEPVDELQKLTDAHSDSRFIYDRDHNKTYHIE